MNKKDLVSAIAKRTSLSKKEAEMALAAFTDIVADTLKNGDKVQITGFGCFEVAERNEHVGHNPKNGNQVLIPAYKAPKFRASETLKNMLKKSD